MVKRLFFYITFITLFIIALFVIMLFYVEHRYSSEVLNDISISRYEDEYKANLKYLNLIKDMVKNKKEQLFNNHVNIKKEQVLSYINSINSLIPVVKNNKSLTDYLFTLPIVIKIVNQQHVAVASNDILSVEKKIELPCDPIEDGYGVCNKTTDDKIYGVIYNHKTGYYIVGESIANPLKSKEIRRSLYDYIKIIPNIVIYKNKEDLIKFTKENFYMMEYEKFLDIFYGIKIDSNKIKRFADSVIDKTKKYEVSIFYNILILLVILILITSLFYWFFYTKIKIADRLYNEYSTNARYDKLTGTLNRYAFENKLKSSSYLRLSLLDLDNFKYINDNFGHHIGDIILKEFVLSVKKYFQDCILGRWGGDEFIMLTSYTKDEIKSALKEINNKLFKLQKSFDNDMKKVVSVSIGSVEIEPYQNFEELFKKADLALYKVKKTHKGDVIFYEDIDYIRIEKSDL